MNQVGKGCKPRPFSVTQDEYANRWDAIFQRELPKDKKPKSDYQDILSTEDCMLNALDNLNK